MTDSQSVYFDSNRPVETFLSSVKLVLTSPRSFLEQMPPAYYYRDGIFLLTLIVMGASILSTPFYNVLFLFMLPMTWGLILISLRLWAGYLSWAVGTFAKQKLSSKRAFQLSAYASVPLLFSFVPVLALIATLWNLYLMWLGLVAHCKVSGFSALMIIVVPLLVLIASTVVLVILLMATMPDFLTMFALLMTKIPGL